MPVPQPAHQLDDAPAPAPAPAARDLLHPGGRSAVDMQLRPLQFKGAAALRHAARRAAIIESERAAAMDESHRRMTAMTLRVQAKHRAQRGDKGARWMKAR